MKQRILQIVVVIPLLFVSLTVGLDQIVKDEDGVIDYANQCETCRLVADEIEDAFRETDKSKDVIVTAKGEKRSYLNSEVRFLETMEDVCQRMLKYRMHKEFSDIRRFQKGRSATMDTLHTLANKGIEPSLPLGGMDIPGVKGFKRMMLDEEGIKGVEVKLDMPQHLWDEPSVEITRLQLECEKLVELYEDDLESWYNRGRKTTLSDYLCRQRALKHTPEHDQSCLFDSRKVEL